MQCPGCRAAVGQVTIYTASYFDPRFRHRCGFAGVLRWERVVPATARRVPEPRGVEETAPMRLSEALPVRQVAAKRRDVDVAAARLPKRTAEPVLQLPAEVAVKIGRGARPVRAGAARKHGVAVAKERGKGEQPTSGLKPTLAKAVGKARATGRVQPELKRVGAKGVEKGQVAKPPVSASAPLGRPGRPGSTRAPASVERSRGASARPASTNREKEGSRRSRKPQSPSPLQSLDRERLGRRERPQRAGQAEAPIPQRAGKKSSTAPKKALTAARKLLTAPKKTAARTAPRVPGVGRKAA